MSAPSRPACFEFAMDFLGEPEESEVRAYVESLEAALAQQAPAAPSPDVEPAGIAVLRKQMSNLAKDRFWMTREQAKYLLDLADATIRQQPVQAAPTTEIWWREPPPGTRFLSEVEARLDGINTRGWSKETVAVQAAPGSVAWNDEAAWALARRAESFGAVREDDDNSVWWTLRIEHFNALVAPHAAPVVGSSHE